MFFFKKSRSVRIRRRVSEVKFMGSEFSSILVGKSGWFGSLSKFRPGFSPFLAIKNLNWLPMNDVVFFSSDSYKGEERLRLNLWKLLIIWHVSTVIIKRMAAGTSCSSLLTLCECMYHKDIKKKNSKIDISFTNGWCRDRKNWTWTSFIYDQFSSVHESGSYFLSLEMIVSDCGSW